MVEGARSNQLVGFGLVVGLDGTGDQVTQTPFTIQAARSMLQQFGVNLPPGVNPAEFIRATIIFAQKYDGVGNAKDQTTGVRGEVLWRQNFGGTNLEYLFPLAKQFSYEYQTATKSSGVFTGRTENLKDTDSPIGARLKRIPEESVEGVIQMFQQKYVSHGN